MAATATTLNVVSYNVLASGLADPKTHYKCTKEHLSAAVRYSKIEAKLQTHIDANAVICLQEVGLDWVGQLTTMFEKNNYTCQFANYGTMWSNCMGVGIAFPREKYSLVSCNIDVVAKLKKWPSPPRQSQPQQGLVASAAAWLMSWLPSGETSAKKAKEDDPYAWRRARTKWNRMVHLTLEDRASKQQVCVATYHMPCMFREPAAMVVHAGLLAQQFLKLNGSNPGVLCGDFNIKPRTRVYELLTTGSYNPEITSGDPEGDKQPTYLVDFDSWRADFSPGLKSAYATALGKEPDFTNFGQAWISYDNSPPPEDHEPFIDTLDFLFFTGESMRVDTVVPLPSRDEVAGPFPNAEEPSDHILIGATFTLG
eukprot:m.358275 g.358275  ORF g.358275 m.358275 type:complete len:368 (-) comp18100_c0_seq1:169-1272(-)